MEKEYRTNATELTDEEIIDGLRNKDERITRQFFYGYCRMAYCVCDKKYDLRFKPGMDFYAIAHEYYLSLDRHGWQQLKDRKPGISLSTWMVNGFRFIILDKLKAQKKEMLSESFEKRVERRNIMFDVPDADFRKEVRTMVESLCDNCLGRDNTGSIILKMILVEGFKGKEVAAQLGITPSAVTQRYQRLMANFVVPYFKNYYEEPYHAEECSSVMADIREAAMPKCCCRAGAGESMPKISSFDNIRKITMDYSKRITPDYINSLAENEIFVFGSNLAGMHGGGAARTARLHFGAVMGQGTGLQGRSYAIPTMQGGPETIQPYVDEFIGFAVQHPEQRFLVTRIGCGIAGFDAEDIAPLFEKAKKVDNICLPEDFWKCLE